MQLKKKKKNIILQKVNVSGKYFLHIHEEIMLSNVLNLYEIWDG